MGWNGCRGRAAALGAARKAPWDKLLLQLAACNRPTEKRNKTT